MAVTKQNIKDIHALSMKKHRDAGHCFVAEGPKVVGDLLPLMACRELYASGDFLNSLSADVLNGIHRIEEVDQKTLERLSLLCAPREALAVFEKPQTNQSVAQLATLPKAQLCLVLDGVQDPGNMGTIVRIADWFGIEHIFASLHTADVFAPKVVQATMGAVGRVKVHYLDLPQLFSSLDDGVAVYGTFLDGKNMYDQEIADNGLIVMGNEGKGISPEVATYINRKLYIPPFPEGRDTSESLNVAVATAVVCAEFRRRAQ